MYCFTTSPGVTQDRSFYDLVRERVELGLAESVIHISATRPQAKQLERRLIAEPTILAMGASNLMTLQEFVARLFRRRYPTTRLLSDAESSVYLESAVNRLKAKHKLQFFESIREVDSTRKLPLPLGTFELLMNTIRRLKEQGIDEEDLKRNYENASKLTGDTTETRRAKDLHAIYTEYQSLLGTHAIDQHGMLLQLLAGDTDSIGVLFRQELPFTDTLLLEGFDHFEQPALSLLTLLARTPELRCSVLMAGGDNAALYSSLDATYDELQRAGFSKCALSPLAEQKPFGSLGENLFQEHVVEPKSVPGLAIWPARNRSDEVTRLARMIRLLLEEHPALGPGDIAVVTPNEDDYASLFRQVFFEHQLPVQINERLRFDRSPVLQGVLAFLDCAERFTINNLARALSNPLFQLSREDGTTMNPSNVIAICTRLALTGSPETWLQTIENERSRVLRELEEERDQLEEVEIGQRRRALVSLDEALIDLKEVGKMLAWFPSTITPSEFRAAIHKMIERVELRRALLAVEQVTPQDAEVEGRAYRVLMRLVEEVDGICHLMGVSGAKLGLEFFVERLRVASLWTRYNPRFRWGDRVLVTSIEQAVGLEFPIVFVLGLTEDAMPGVYEPDVLLPEEFQRGERRKLQEERRMFVEALGLASHQTYLSYPERSESGTEMMPSPFLRALAEIAIPEIDTPMSLRTDHFGYPEVARSIRRASGSELESIASTSKQSDHIIGELVGELVPLLEDRALMQRTRSQSGRSTYGGQVNRAALSEAETQFLEGQRDRTWSVSQLETYANCPFQYFSRQVLRLESEEAEREGLSPLDRGNLVHQILRDFFTERRSKQLAHLSDVEEPNVFEVFEHAERLVADSLRRTGNHDPLWRLDSEELAFGASGGVLERLIRKERELAGYSTRPAFFEVSFGSPGRDPSKRDTVLFSEDPIAVGTLKLRGKIDRIDFGSDGFNVIDYKTGKTPSRTSFAEHRSLQLPLYLRVAEELLARLLGEPQRGLAALYHNVLDEKSKRTPAIALKEWKDRAFESFRSSNALIETEEEFRRVIDEAVEFAQRYVDGISAGKFGLTTKKLVPTICNHCDLRPACRVNEALQLHALE